MANQNSGLQNILADLSDGEKNMAFLHGQFTRSFYLLGVQNRARCGQAAAKTRS